MKPLMISALLAALVTLYFSTSVQAGAHDPGVNARQHHQQQRMKQGVRSGELTRGETRHLANEQRHIRAEERRYKADGKLTRVERGDLNHDLNQVSRHIYNEKHDAEKR